MYLRQKGRCYDCGKKLGNKWHRDHRVPRSRGGSDHVSNAVLLCPVCNLKKGAKFPHEWVGAPILHLC